MIGYEEALNLVNKNLKPLPPQKIPALYATGYVLAAEVRALVNVPQEDVSLKDGYAVRAKDISEASPEKPVALKLMGEISAGERKDFTLGPNTCVRVTAGALLPKGADAVLAEEFARKEGSVILALADAPPGKNILPRGTDVLAGEVLLPRGQKLTPLEVGLLAAAGVEEILVYPKPRIFLLATGDEVVAPGHPLKRGELYASNLVTLSAWCSQFGLPWVSRVVKDEAKLLEQTVEEFLSGPWEVLITSGGAWRGPKDLIVKVLERFGWQKIFHRVRMGPGKAVAFGLLKEKVVFCLPGGPPSNQMAFLNLALPGVLLLTGNQGPPFPETLVKLSQDVGGQKDWTQFLLGELKREGETLLFKPLKPKSRLSYLAQGEALIRVPEGEEKIRAGAMVCARLLKMMPPCKFT